jgi:hypothetical protein
VLLALTAVAIAAVLVLTRTPAAPPQGEPGGPGVVPAADPDPWTAVDWSEVRGAFPVNEPGLFRIDGVADGGELNVAWGSSPTPGRNQFNAMGSVFLSRDGVAWRTVLLDHGVGPLDTSEIAGVAGGPMGLLAFGGVCCASETRAIWLSSDGLRWERVELKGDLDRSAHHISAVVGTDDGWVAVGSRDDGRGGIWTSHDGITWDAVDLDFPQMPWDGVSDIAPFVDGFVAVGTIDAPDGTHDGGIWRSDDGIRWERIGADDPSLTGPGEQEVLGVVGHAGGLFVTGSHGATLERQQCEEIVGMIGSTEPMPPEPQTAVSCGWGRQHNWMSADGEQWLRTDPAAAPDMTPTEFRVVSAGGPGVVVLGESSGPASPDTNLFTSADGQAWSVVEPREPFGRGVAIGMVVQGRRVVAIVDDSDEFGSTTFRVFVGEIR